MDRPKRSADPAGWHALPGHPVDRTARSGQDENDDPGGPIDAADDDLFAEVDRRPGRTTVLLIAGILASVVFVGGVLVQKHHGGTTSGALAASGLADRVPGTGPGSGGFAPGGGFPGAAQTGAAGGAAAGGGAAVGGAAAATPVVVGTVTKLSGSSLTVQNLGGRRVNVRVPAGTTIILVAGTRLTTLRIGSTVSVAGTPAAGGTVTATSITVRS